MTVYDDQFINSLICNKNSKKKKLQPPCIPRTFYQELPTWFMDGPLLVELSEGRHFCPLHLGPIKSSSSMASAF